MLIIYIILAAVLAIVRALMNNMSGMELIGSVVLGFIVLFMAELLLHTILLVIVALPVDISKTQKEYSRFYGKLTCVTAKLIFDLLNIKIKVEGEELIPKERFLLIQNHRTLFDPVASLYVFEKYQLGFVTKPENIKLPIVGKIAHKICALPIDRENARNAMKTINEAVDYIKNDICSIGIYPEGTRNKKNASLLPFRNGALKIAVKAGCPLVVTALTGVDDIFKNAPFKRTELTMKICGVFSGEKVKSMKTFQLAEESRKLLCEALSIVFVPEEE